MAFLELTLTDGGGPTVVNAAHIIRWTPYSGGSKLFFDEGPNIYVTDTPAEIMRKIKAARANIK